MVSLEKILRNVEMIEPKKELIGKLEVAEKKRIPLKVKLGFDPTAPDLHLGHAVVLRKLRDFQELGHRVIIVIGDYTARIGDPTGRNELRPPLSKEDVDAHAQTYLNQLSLILDRDKIEVLRNSHWFGKMDFADALSLSAQFTLAQILQRKDFKSRFEEGIPVHMHELMYPMMQGYDSVEIHADIEIGGTDQIFNCLVGRELQKIQGREPQVVMSMPLLPGTDGVEKMSKSKGNYIAFTDTPKNMYGKIMSVSDRLLPLYIQLLTDFDESMQKDFITQMEKNLVNPMHIKKKVAWDITNQFHGKDLAQKAQESFEKNVQEKNLEGIDLPILTLDIPEGTSISLMNLCLKIKDQAQLDMSNSQLRRLIEQGGMSVDNKKQTVPNQILCMHTDMLVKIGKRSAFRLATTLERS